MNVPVYIPKFKIVLDIRFRIIKLNGADTIKPIVFNILMC